MPLFDELIFWINWCMAWLTTLGIWYCWFIILRVSFLGNLNYGISKYPIQDSVVDFLVLIRLIRQDDKHYQPYVPTTFFGYKLNSLHYFLAIIILATLIPFCYYSVSNYNIIIPKEHNTIQNPFFDFIFKFTLKSMLYGTIIGFFYSILPVLLWKVALKEIIYVSLVLFYVFFA